MHTIVALTVNVLQTVLMNRSSCIPDSATIMVVVPHVSVFFLHVWYLGLIFIVPFFMD